VVATILVAGLELERARDRVHAGVAFGTRTRFSGRGAEVGREPRPDAVDQRRVAPIEREELDRRALELELQALVLLEHLPGHAPNEPWLRKTTSGSSRKSSRTGAA
jgi:hypothetical protein